MDEIKSNFDREIEAQFTDKYPKPKRLSFDYLNTTFENATTKKRKLSDAGAEKNDEFSSCNASNSSLNMSSWETRILKADLVEAQSRIISLKKEIEQQNRIRSEMELNFQHKIDQLTKETTHKTAKVDELEKMTKALRKSERKYREAATKANAELSEYKTEADERYFTLEQEFEDFQQTARSSEFEYTNEISELTRALNEEQMNKELLQSENARLEARNAELEERQAEMDAIRKSFEEEQTKLALAESKIKTLEYELAGYGEYQGLAKVTKERLNKFDEMEREVERLTTKNKQLYDLIGGKLLMEEQIHDLKSRLENADKEREELVQIRVKFDALEQELQEWKKLAADYIPNDFNPGPAMLRRKIDDILQKDLQIANDSAAAKSEKALMECEKDELKTQAELQKKQIEDLQRGLKHHQTILSRLQKKLQLVAKERDAYKQLLDNYEKDLTISSASSLNAPDSQTRLRIDNLEKTLAGYKDVCARLEQELEAAKATPSDFSNNISEQFEVMKKELNLIRTENERLRRRKDELELELENHLLRASVMGPQQSSQQPSSRKILHFSNNPASEAHRSHMLEIEKLQAEVERLKKKCKKLEEGNLELTTRLQDESMMTMNLKDINKLTEKNKSLEAKNKHLKEIYKSMSQELREVVYMLFGFRVDRVGNGLYRISSMYADAPEDFLNVRLSPEGSLDLLESDYYESLSDLIQSTLAMHSSMPAFLSTLTLELFNRTTMCM
ncbi:mitotic spindle assembly checkpoint protein MAD1 [Culicoides brevitarsis]|uniref:mitotic spindle assembly checkpoint protein MAD1 n=1 Tax=Culicoides brevitarsis TaxID=469753 RepID=UPI00307BD220